MAQSQAGLEKVTAIITRVNMAEKELLLIRHPYAGIQLPAGTVEPGEAPATAVLREVREETGLAAVKIVTELGAMEEQRGTQWRVMVADTEVYTRPDQTSAARAQLRRGLGVTEERNHAEWTQVTYVERDSLEADAPVSCRITGWVPATNVAMSQRRHFFLLTPTRMDSRLEWMVHSDFHDFTLYWAPVTRRPRLVEPQEAWLDHLRDKLGFRLDKSNDQ